MLLGTSFLPYCVTWCYFYHSVLLDIVLIILYYLTSFLPFCVTWCRFYQVSPATRGSLCSQSHCYVSSNVSVGEWTMEGCVAPPPIRGTVVVNRRSLYQPGEFVLYRCNHGNGNFGYIRRDCQHNHEWSERDRNCSGTDGFGGFCVLRVL